MNLAVELPESDFIRLKEAAAAEGVTPAEWIAARLPAHVDVQTCSNGRPAPRADLFAERIGRLNSGSGEPVPTLAERFAGRVGVIASGGKERLSEHGSEIFREMLDDQRKAGRL